MPPTDSRIRAVRLDGPGGPEVLRLVETGQPEPGPGEIRVRHAAIGLNFIDVYQRTGLYPLARPSGLGLEAAGVVETTGPGVRRFRPGDRVAYANGPVGTYAEAHIVPEGRAVRVPDDLPLETAAGALLKGMTAEMLLRRVFHVKPGQTILLHAAAGGVGLLLAQWARALGARVIGTVGDAVKAELALARGCDHVILYGEEDVAERVRALTDGEGVAVVYDSVGAATAEASLDSLARRGMYVSFGNASGPAPAVAPLRLSRGGSLFMTRPTLFDYVATTDELDAAAAALFRVIRDGSVQVRIGQTFPLAEAAEAHRALEARRTTGSTLLIP